MEDIRSIITAILLITGTFFMLVGSIGILRMPDLFLRMSATSKASTLGAACMLLGAGIYFHDDLGSSARILAIIVFLFLTAPVAAHMIGRAGYFTGVQLWEGTVVDELEGRYNHQTGSLNSPLPRNTQEVMQARIDGREKHS